MQALVERLFWEHCVDTRGCAIREATMRSQLRLGSLLAAPVLLGAVLAPVPIVQAASAAAPPRGVPADFDGDGDSDLAVGAPGYTVADRQDAGAVVVYRSTSAGLAGPRIITQSSGGVPDSSQSFD